ITVWTHSIIHLVNGVFPRSKRLRQRLKQKRPLRGVNKNGAASHRPCGSTRALTHIHSSWFSFEMVTVLRPILTLRYPSADFGHTIGPNGGGQNRTAVQRKPSRPVFTS